MSLELTSSPIVPVVHLNGTSKRDLCEQRHMVYEALTKAYEQLNHMAPHMRDYYPVPGLFSEASEQHERRAMALLGLIAEVEAEIHLLEYAS